MGHGNDQGSARVGGPTFEVSVFWVLGLVSSVVGFLLTFVSLTLPWTFVYPRPGEVVAPGGPETAFLTRISNYDPASTATVLLVIGFALVVSACFGTVGAVNRVLRVATTAAGLFVAWFVAVLYILVLDRVGYGYVREIGTSVRISREVYNTEPSVGLSLCCLGVLMMAAGAALAVRPAGLRIERAAQVHRLGYLCAGVALVLLVGSFSEPWLRQPADPLAADPVWGGRPQLDSWLVIFRFTTVAALVLLAVLILSKSARVRRRLATAGLVACATTVSVLVTARLIVWLPEVEVEVRPTYYLAIGAALLLSLAFLDSAFGRPAEEPS